MIIHRRASVRAIGQPLSHMPDTQVPPLAGYEEPSPTHPWQYLSSSSWSQGSRASFSLPPAATMAE
jgi:hypothetical protein